MLRTAVQWTGCREDLHRPRPLRGGSAERHLRRRPASCFRQPSHLGDRSFASPPRGGFAFSMCRARQFGDEDSKSRNRLTNLYIHLTAAGHYSHFLRFHRIFNPSAGPGRIPASSDRVAALAQGAAQLLDVTRVAGLEGDVHLGLPEAGVHEDAVVLDAHRRCRRRPPRSPGASRPAPPGGRGRGCAGAPGAGSRPDSGR